MNEGILHAAFLPFGDVKDCNIPLDHATQKNKGFGFVTFEEKCVRECEMRSELIPPISIGLWRRFASVCHGWVNVRGGASFWGKCSADVKTRPSLNKDKFRAV